MMEDLGEVCTSTEVVSSKWTADPVFPMVRVRGAELLSILKFVKWINVRYPMGIRFQKTNCTTNTVELKASILPLGNDLGKTGQCLKNPIHNAIALKVKVITKVARCHFN